MGGAVKWLVCAGPGEFLFIAAALVATGCSGSVEWERCPERACARAAQLQAQANVNVVVGGGLERDDSEEVACALANLAKGMSIWCASGARAYAARVYARGVDAAVEPAGLMQVLAAVAARGDAAETDDNAIAATVAETAAAETIAAGTVPTACDIGTNNVAGSICAVTAAAHPDYGGREALAVSGRPDDFDDPPSGNPMRCGAVPSSRVPALDGSVVPVVRDRARRRVKRSGSPKVSESSNTTGLSGAPGAMGIPGAPCAPGMSGVVGTAEVTGRFGNSPYPKAPAIQIGGVTTEPIAYRPLIDLPQFECEVAGADVHVPTICFTSARGGVGKTSLAVLMALTLARDGLTVALVDFDFQFGTCLRCIGGEETFGLIDVGAPPEQIRVDAQTLARCRTTPERGLAAYEFCRAPEQAEVLTGMAGRLLRSARAGADIAVVDLPAGMNEAVVQTLDLADRCLFVADQRAFSLESLIAQQSLCARMGVARTKLMTVMNRCDPRHRDEGFLSRVRFEIQTPQVMRVVDGGAEVAQMMSIGSAGELLAMRNRFALSAADLAHALCADVGCQPHALPAVGPMSPVLATVPAQRTAPREGLFKKRRKDKRGDQVICPF